MGPGASSAAVGYLLVAALVLSLGAVAGRWLLIPRVASDVGPSFAWLERRAASVGVASGIVLAMAIALFFVRQLAEFRDPFAPLTEDAGLLLDSAWGTTWRWGMVGAFVASAGFLSARAGIKAGWVVATGAVLALGAFPAFTGHAAGEERLRALALFADVAHVWAAGGWIGLLTLILHMEWRWRSRSDAAARSLLPGLVPVFSPIAMACVATLVVTGGYAAWLHVPGIGALVSTGYGRTLVAKLALVGVVLGLGALNFRVLTPRLETPEGGDALRRAATAEVLLAQVVLFLTAILVRLPPLEP
jgi:putative copper export protein